MPGLEAESGYPSSARPLRSRQSGRAAERQMGEAIRGTAPGFADELCMYWAGTGDLLNRSPAARGPGQVATPQLRKRRRTLGNSGAGSVCSRTSGNAP